MLKSQYESYNKKFAQFFEATKRRTEADALKQQLDAKKKVLNQKLLELSAQSTELQLKKASLKQLQKEIEKKEDEIKKRGGEVEKFQRICDDKLGVIQHNVKYLQAFRKKFRDDYENCQTKYKETDVLEFLLVSRQRVLMLELCSIFFSEKSMNLFTGARLLHKATSDFSDILGKEDEISMTLGYIVLVLNLVAKYTSVPLKFPMQFAGSRSIIIKNSLENYPLHISKVYDKNKFNMALMHLFANFQQIFEYFNVDRKHKKLSFKVLLNSLVNLLYDGCIKPEK